MAKFVISTILGYDQNILDTSQYLLYNLEGLYINFVTTISIIFIVYLEGLYINFVW